MRALALALVVLAAAPSARAQLSAGFKAGLNLADVRNANGGIDLPSGVTQEPRVGGTGGVWLRYALAPAVGLQAEALYAQKGTRIAFRGDGESGEIRLELDYVEIPVLLRVSPDAGSGLGLGLYGGGAYAVKVREALTVVSGGESQTTTGSDSYAPSDAGVVAGLDVSVGNVGIDLRYTHGLLDLRNDVPEGTESPTPTNGAFSATLTLGIGR